MSAKQLLAVLLSILLIDPSPLMAALSGSAPRSVMASVTSRGTVRVGETLVPSLGVLFSDDQVQSNLGSAIIQYEQGPRVLLATESSAQFTSSHVQLQRGQMVFRTVSGSGPAFAASTLRLEPATTKTIAHVTLQDKKASVSVTKGTLNIVDPSGVRLASLSAGQASVFQEASAALPADVAGPATAFIGEATVVWILLGAGLAAFSTLVLLDRAEEAPVMSPPTP